MRSLGVLPAPLLVLVSTLAHTLVHVQAEEAPGLQIETTTAVTCSRPSRSGDRIAVDYRGSLQSTGDVFDESYKRGKPFVFTLGAGQVIEGWDQGLLDMCPGEARTLTIPSDLAYGDSGRPPVIPGKATLIFATELRDIVGVEQESLSFVTETISGTAAATTTEDEEMFTIATAPPVPPESSLPTTALTTAPPIPIPEDMPADTEPATTQQELDNQDSNNGECSLLGPFALLVQGALGVVALLSLVYKRWREENKRPWKIWFFDVSKQVVGSMLTHVLNLAMSMLSSVDMMNAAQRAATTAAAATATSGSGDGVGVGSSPNPCSFYLLNLAIDTTIGIPVLYLLLKVLHGLFLYTPLAKPPESIRTGNYGTPPTARWWLKQSLIYFIGLTGMKLFVFFLFAALPWLPWVGDWALRWTKGNEALEIAFAMFIFPLFMNALQYWLIDSFIMDKTRGQQGSGGDYQAVRGEEDEDGRRDDDESFTEVDEDSQTTKASGGASTKESLREVAPTPLSDNNEQTRMEGESSRTASPRKKSV